MRLPVSWDMLLGGQSLAPSWDSGGSVLWLCLGMASFFIMRSDEVFAGASGVVHAEHCLTYGDVALFYCREPVRYIGVAPGRSRGGTLSRTQGCQAQAGSVIVRTRSAVRGPRSGFGHRRRRRFPHGGYMLSRYPALPEHGPLASYRIDHGVRV